MFSKKNKDVRKEETSDERQITLKVIREVREIANRALEEEKEETKPQLHNKKPNKR